MPRPSRLKTVITIAALFGLVVLSAPSRKPNNIVEAIVTYVVDGDTIFVAVQGQEYQTRRIRLLGVDTPETVHPNKPVQFYGPEASAFAKAQLSGKRVWLEYDVSPMDHYQRHLAYVWLAEPIRGRITEQTIRDGMFNAWLLTGGYGKALNIEPNSRYAVLLEKFQDEARAARRGLWQ